MNALRFREDDDEDRQGPPNYQSRSVQTKLLGLVFTLMLVIALAVRARDPANYAWMWKLGQDEESEDEESEDSLSEASTDSDLTNHSDLTAEASNDGSPTARIQLDFVGHLIDDTTAAQQESLLRRVNQYVTPERDYRIETDPVQSTATRRAIQSTSAAYFDEALASLEPDDRVWRQPLIELRDDWLDLLNELFPTPDDSTDSAEPAQRDWGGLANGVRRHIENRLLSQVKDNTMFERHESLGWWTLLRRAVDRSTSTSPAAELTSRLQLAEQSAAYRGQPVQVRGRVLRAYTVEAQLNPFEVTHYNVLWLRPEGGDHLPIAVYCLKLPPGFPELEPLAQEGNQFDEEVEVTGWFYKHWAYASKTGLSLAPLLVANSPTWYPRPATKTKRTHPALATAQLLLAVMAALVIARIVLRWSRWDNVSSQRLAGESRVDTLSANDLGPSVEDALRDLKNRDLKNRDLKDRDEEPE